MDIVFIRDLKVQTVIGVFEWERAIRQTVILDLEMAFDIASAARSDHIDDALNYKAVADRLTQFLQETHFKLVEAMAEAISNILQQEFGVSWLRLRVSKPGAIPTAHSVGVLIERGSKA